MLYTSALETTMSHVFMAEGGVILPINHMMKFVTASASTDKRTALFREYLPKVKETYSVMWPDADFGGAATRGDTVSTKSLNNADFLTLGALLGFAVTRNHPEHNVRAATSLSDLISRVLRSSNTGSQAQFII